MREKFLDLRYHKPNCLGAEFQLRLLSFQLPAHPLTAFNRLALLLKHKAAFYQVYDGQPVLQALSALATVIQLCTPYRSISSFSKAGIQSSTLRESPALEFDS